MLEQRIEANSGALAGIPDDHKPLILSAAREIPREHNNIRSANPQWQTTIPLGLYGKTLGLVGLGRLGSRVAEVRIWHLCAVD